MNEKKEPSNDRIPLGILVKRLLIGTSILSLTFRYMLYPEITLNYCAIISLYSTFFGIPIARMLKI